MQVTCLNCKDDFEKTPSAVKRSPRHFCSRSCAASFNNRKSPKRKPEGRCRVCQAPIPTTQVWCSNACKEKTLEENARKWRAARGSHVVSWRQRTKLKAIAYKGGACQVCGYSRSVRSLEFHHLDPAKKDFGIGGCSLAWGRIEKELDKCVLLCSNCHGEVHDGLLAVTITGSGGEI